MKGGFDVDATRYIYLFYLNSGISLPNQIKTDKKL